MGILILEAVFRRNGYKEFRVAISGRTPFRTGAEGQLRR